MVACKSWPDDGPSANADLVALKANITNRQLNIRALTVTPSSS
jgi:hypothetical protein